MRHPLYTVTHSVVPINSSLLTVTLYSSVITTHNIRSISRCYCRVYIRTTAHWSQYLGSCCFVLLSFVHRGLTDPWECIQIHINIDFILFLVSLPCERCGHFYRHINPFSCYYLSNNKHKAAAYSSVHFTSYYSRYSVSSNLENFHKRT